jgi:hypothetical protein
MFKICKLIKKINLNYYSKCDCTYLCKIKQAIYDHEEKYLYYQLLKILNKDIKNINTNIKE